jgi:hypothetical protein
MQRKHIPLFEIGEDEGLALLADALIYMVDALKGAGGLIFAVRAQPVIETLRAYPGTPEECTFLAFNVGALCQCEGTWHALSLLLLLCRAQRMKEHEVRAKVQEFLSEILFCNLENS